LAPYLTAIESGQTPVAGKEALTVEQEMIEAIYLGLRMTPGIDLIWFKKKFGIDFLETYNEIISDLEKSNYIEVVNDHCALTRRERVYLDSIAAMFVAEDISDIIPCAIF
jgi:oxygen-independent coproporphyrinogen-3 oxidase